MSSTRPLWTPDAERIGKAPLTAFHGQACRKRRHSLLRLCRPAPLVGRATRRLLEPVLGFLRHRRREGRSRAGRRRQHAGGACLLPRRASSISPRTCCAERRRRRARLPRRGQGRARAVLGRASRAGVAAAAGVARRSASEPGDRVAAMLPNMPEAIAAMLAAASLGAIWSSCSPDFGERGVLDRFGQIEPVLFIASTAIGTTARRSTLRPRSSAVAGQAAERSQGR